MKKIKYLVLVCIIIIIAVNLIPKNEEGKKLLYTITDTDSSNTSLILRLTIDHRTSEDTLAMIAEKIKKERNWNEKLVCFFYIKVPSNSFAWASYSYLPKCDDCIIDAEGNKIQYNLIGMRGSLADSLSKLTLDTIKNKILLTSFLEDTWKCKTQLFIVENDSNKVLMARLFSNKEFVLTFLDKKEVNEEIRYYFREENDKYFITINELEKTVNHSNSDGKIWQSNYIIQ